MGSINSQVPTPHRLLLPRHAIPKSTPPCRLSPPPFADANSPPPSAGTGSPLLQAVAPLLPPPAPVPALLSSGRRPRRSDGGVLRAVRWRRPRGRATTAPSKTAVAARIWSAEDGASAGRRRRRGSGLLLSRPATRRRSRSWSSSSSLCLHFPPLAARKEGRPAAALRWRVLGASTAASSEWRRRRPRRRSSATSHLLAKWAPRLTF